VQPASEATVCVAFGLAAVQLASALVVPSCRSQCTSRVWVACSEHVESATLQSPVFHEKPHWLKSDPVSSVVGFEAASQLVSATVVLSDRPQVTDRVRCAVALQWLS